jgi:hypothetical protein
MPTKLQLEERVKELEKDAKITALERRVEELEARAARDVYDQPIYPPNANHAWANTGDAFKRARREWLNRNGKTPKRSRRKAATA